MGYMHIDNLYKNQEVMIFKEVFALEKIHGTSAHIGWKDGALRFFSGGMKHETFTAIFDAPTLVVKFAAMNHPDVTVYGEAYGGKMQAMAKRYGPAARFAAFDVKVGDLWLDVPTAAQVVADLGLEFVYYALVPATVEALNAERDAPSKQAQRNGVEGAQHREGIVIRPPIEVRKNNGERIIAKHKRDEERETKTPREVASPEKLAVLSEAQAIAQEWVTPTRLQHVIDKLPHVTGIEHTGDLVKAMTEDVMREGTGEILDSREARQAIGRATAEMWKRRIKTALERVR